MKASGGHRIALLIWGKEQDIAFATWMKAATQRHNWFGAAALPRGRRPGDEGDCPRQERVFALFGPVNSNHNLLL